MLPTLIPSPNFLTSSLIILSTFTFSSSPEVPCPPVSPSLPLLPSNWGCYLPSNLIVFPMLFFSFSVLVSLVFSDGSPPSLIFSDASLLPYSLSAFLEEFTSDINDLNSSLNGYFILQFLNNLSLPTSLSTASFQSAHLWSGRAMVGSPSYLEFRFSFPLLIYSEDIPFFPFWVWPTTFTAFAPQAFQTSWKW